MFSTPKQGSQHRFSITRWRLRKKAATAIIAAFAGSAALAASASANPFDFTAANAGSTQYGIGCAPVGAPAIGGLVDWNVNAAGTNVTPQLIGDICLRNSNAQARVILEYRDVNHVPITTVPGPTVTGTGAPLDVYPVNVTGLPVAVAAVTHIHVRLQDNRFGALADVAVATADF
jgi:hypothetical protein